MKKLISKSLNKSCDKLPLKLTSEFWIPELLEKKEIQIQRRKTGTKSNPLVIGLTTPLCLLPLIKRGKHLPVNEAMMTIEVVHLK